jgi:heme-degrading monooxygenase HmoA
MTAIVKLSSIIDALDHPEEWECLLDRNTGQIITITDDDSEYLEADEAELADLPEWQQDSVRAIRTALEGADTVELPGKVDLHEWDIMRRFAESHGDPVRRRLLNAIRGKGAFRAFRTALDQLRLRDAWYAWRELAVREFVKDWLEEEDIAFIDDLPPVEEPPEPAPPIARVWRGWTRAEDADRYLAYLEETGLEAYHRTPGNLDAFVLRRIAGDRAEFLLISHWESLAAIRAFAGDDIERAVFYPEDERYLVERDTDVTHYEIIFAD